MFNIVEMFIRAIEEKDVYIEVEGSCYRLMQIDDKPDEITIYIKEL